MLNRRFTKFLLFAGGWTLLGLTFGGQLYAGYIYTGQEIRILPALAIGLVNSYTWAALSIPIIWFSSKFPWRRERWKQVLLLHLAGSLIFCVLQLWLEAQIQTLFVYGLMNFGTPDASGLFYYLLVKKSQLNLLIYWAIILVIYVWQYYQRQVQSEAQLRIELTQAQLTALRMQLQPHFLFNTLHSISVLIHEDARAADRMIVLLSDLLRLTLADYKQQEIPLEKELEILQKYLAIEQIRFQDRLQVRINIEQLCYDALLPSFLLQPIVENAIRHGIEFCAGVGHIEIFGGVEANKLRLRVRNNGQILPQFKEGVGLSNTRSRLERLYGSDFSLELQNLDSSGVEVAITLPLKFESFEMQEEFEFSVLPATAKVLNNSDA